MTYPIRRVLPPSLRQTGRIRPKYVREVLLTL